MTIGRLFKILFIAISLLTASVLSVGCEDSPSISTPGSVTAPSSESAANFPASEYPADINGRVTIAEAVQAKYDRDKPDTMELTPLEGKIFWIVDITVKNNSYENEVATIPKGYRSDYPCYHWKIIVDDRVYDAQEPFQGIPSAYPMSVPMGETGETTIRFIVPDTLKVNDAKLCYLGQEPYSYGTLTGGEKVAMYDWDLKKVIVLEKPSYEQTVFIKSENGWEITLNKHSIKSSTVTVSVSVTSHFSSPKDYYPFNTGEGEMVCVDQYGIAFTDAESRPWYEGRYYPGDTKTGDITFTVNPKSGRISLWLYQVTARFGTSSIYANYNQIKLFDLGEVK